MTEVLKSEETGNAANEKPNHSDSVQLHLPPLPLPAFNNVANGNTWQ